MDCELFGFVPLVTEKGNIKGFQTRTKGNAGEDLVGARAWRVLFAGISLPLATVALFYFINHRYDGDMLWNVRGVPGVHTALWVTNFVSFLFLYTSTFNLLEVAAVDRPQLHLWETGVMRITRHPQVCFDSFTMKITCIRQPWCRSCRNASLM